jgi:hypothetical protein
MIHFVVQGAIKLVEVPDAAMGGLAIAWIVLAAIAPWTMFALRPRHAQKT